MLIRQEDFDLLIKLGEHSHKKVWFTCEECGIGVLQAYRNYLKQKHKKMCRWCRNKYTASLPEVKKKQSLASKKKWEDLDYRKHMSKVLSIACQKAWDQDDGTRKIWLIENNPMKNLISKEKISKKNSASINDLKEICKLYNFEYLGRKRNSLGGTRIIIKCKNGHITEKRLDAFRQGHYKCNLCPTQFSNEEKEIAAYIKNLGFDIIENDRSIIYPKELDIVIPSEKIAIEYCGIYWHSEKAGMKKNYHSNKLKLCENNGYRLITIFEDEWKDKQKIVKTRLKHILGVNNNKIYARKCKLQEINHTQASTFVDKYHINGYTRSNIKLGAFYSNELVAVMTFSNAYISKRNNWEINRFCSKYSIIGIASKFLKHFQRNYDWTEIFTYADKRWDTGNVYEKIGFDQIGYTKSNYWYFNLNNNLKRYHRLNFTKKLLPNKLENFDPNLSEWENMKAHGWNRIWDCGNVSFVLKKK